MTATLTSTATPADALRGASPGAERSRVRSPASGVRLRVIVPLAIAMLLLVGAFIAAFVFEAQHREADDIARTAASVDAMFKAQSAEGTQVMRTIMELVLKKRSLEAALRAQDREKLLELSTPILNEIRTKNRITHFYYILPDRTMLLRVQAPDKHGDKIERFVLREAQRTGKPFWGNEQGPLGSFTLRVVYPWVSNGEVIGYLEMGIEFEDIMQSIKNFLDVDVFVAINKSFFNRAKWDEAQAKSKRPVAWDEFPSVVVLSRTANIPPPIESYLSGLKEEHSKRSFQITWGGQVAQTVVAPFANLRGEQLGELVVVRDITAGAKERRQTVIGVALLSALIGGGLLLFFHVLLGHVQRDVAERTSRLGEAQRVLTVEQLERKRAEGELAAQQERNELLEARSRMVSELAAAKEAAEVALKENETVTAQLRSVQGELLAAARLAGMAEIATNVLHNVGNVLNSVNVSAGLVSTKLRTSKVGGLARAVALIDEHADDLGEFLAHDARGKMLPGYLRELALALQAERDSMAQELDALGKSVDHIKQVVATQQSYASAPRVVESVALADLLDDALRMNAGALTRHNIDVVKNLADLPVLPLDRNRLLQILVNLISNAKHAVTGQPDRKARITLAAGLEHTAQGRALRITVSDNGEGIAPENLTRVFAHGFTTRKDGHGFGLHSCVLAAQEMGGRLRAHSAGRGQGARFELELPVAIAEAR